MPAHPLSKDIEAVLSTIDQANWSKLSFPYTFSVIDTSGGGSSNPFTDFSLPISPNSIRQSEEFAISIKPTQGGTTVTHSGNRYKMLTIKGTTGIAPFRGTGGAANKTGEAIFSPNELKYRSGYEVFLRLRNWFRAYYEHKKSSGREAQGLRLIFKNYKDGEFLVVELLKFDMDRQAARSFLYDYELEFKVISHFAFQKVVNKTTGFEKALGQAVELIDTARGVFLRSQGILRQIESTYNSVILEPLRKTSLAIKAAQGLPLLAGDIGNRIISNTVSEANALAIALGIASQQKENRKTGGADPRIAAIKLPNDLESAVENQGADLIIGFGEGLMALGTSGFTEATLDALDQEQEDATRTTRAFYEDTIAELNRVKQNAEDFFNLGDTTYDALFDRTSTLSADFAKVITNEELDLLNAFTDALTGLRLLLSTEDLFRSTFDERIADIVERFDGNIELFANPAVRQITLPAGTTLERLAQRELGDSTRWGEIAEANGLLSPYIVDDPSDTRSNVVRPGEKILIPTQVRSGFSQVPSAKEIKTTRGLSALEKSLGTDFKLDENFDLTLTSSGDLEVVSGADNMGQAVLLKLGYEPGELMRYPELGAGILPGTKFPPLQQIKDGVINTLLQDTRIDRVLDLSLIRNNSELSIRFNIKIKQIDVPVPIEIKVA